MVNRVILVGYLGKDPEMRRLEGGIAVARFSLATSESYRDREGAWQQQTEWHEVTLWRQMAERAEQQLSKGMLVYLEGKLNTKTWQDKEGVTRKATEVVGSQLRILNRPPAAEPEARPGVEAAPGSGAADLVGFLRPGGSAPEDL